MPFTTTSEPAEAPVRVAVPSMTTIESTLPAMSAWPRTTNSEIDVVACRDGDVVRDGRHDAARVGRGLGGERGGRRESEQEGGRGHQGQDAVHR